MQWVMTVLSFRALSFGWKQFKMALNQYRLSNLSGKEKCLIGALMGNDPKNLKISASVIGDHLSKMPVGLTKWSEVLHLFMLMLAYLLVSTLINLNIV